MASATPHLRLPLQPQDISATWPVLIDIAWFQKHVCEQFAEGCYLKARGQSRTHDLHSCKSSAQTHWMSCGCLYGGKSCICYTTRPRCFKKILQFLLFYSWLTQIDLYSGHKATVCLCVCVIDRFFRQQTAGTFGFVTLLHSFFLQNLHVDLAMWQRKRPETDEAGSFY